MLRYIKAFLLFWYDFIVGDDWVIALGVAFTLSATYWLVQNHHNVWWVLPVAVVLLLAISLGREAQRASADTPKIPKTPSKEP